MKGSLIIPNPSSDTLSPVLGLVRKVIVPDPSAPEAFSGFPAQADSPATAAPDAAIVLRKSLLDISFFPISRNVICTQSLSWSRPASDLAVDFMPLDVYCAERPRRTQILAGSAADAFFGVNGRYLQCRSPVFSIIFHIPVPVSVPLP